MSINLDLINGLKEKAYTCDQLLRGKVTLLQLSKGHRAGLEAVFLGASVTNPLGPLLDAGAGTGAISLCIGTRFPFLPITALENDSETFSLLRQNVQGTTITPVEEDLLTFPKEGCFQEVVTNPPFFLKGTPSFHKPKARHTSPADLSAWFRACIRLLSQHGRLTTLLPTPLQDLLFSLPEIGGWEIFPLIAKEGQPPKRTLFRGRKGVLEKPQIFPGLILHTSSGGWTLEAESILSGSPLPWNQ